MRDWFGRFPQAFRGYTIAVLATAIVVVARSILAPVFGDSAPFVPFILPVLLAAWFGGMRAGLLATLLGAVANVYLFVPPRYSPRIHSDDIATLVLYIITSIAVCWLSGRLRKTQQALQEKEHELELITGITPVALTRCSRDLRYRFANRAAAELYNVAPEQIVGRKIVDVIGEAAFNVIRPHVERVLRGEQVEYEAQVPFSGGNAPWIRVTYSPDRDMGGEVIGWVASIVDVTARRRAEDALREADARKDDFLAMLSHEMRNSLMPIHTALHILRSKPTEVGWMEMLERQVNHLTRIIEDLMDVSRMRRGRLTLQRAPVALRAILEHAVETSRPLLEQTEHPLSLELPQVPIVIDADGTRLVQIFSNLLNNAAKFSPRGSQIELVAIADDHAAVISVRDHGIGIPREHQVGIFEPFTQLAPREERRHGGLGIGLALVKRLVELHGGSITVGSDRPGGTTEFTVRLPAVEQQPAARAAITSTADASEYR